MVDRPPAGWFADPLRRFQYRYWDGFEWTDLVASQGHAYQDPVLRAKPQAVLRTDATSLPNARPLSATAETTPDVLTVPSDGLKRRWFGLSQRPRRPRRRRVRKPRVGFRPPAEVWQMADRCVKCNRPLTDPRSKRARVGTKCIKIYGSQQRRIPNPDHAQWLTRKSQAEATYAMMKSQAEADYLRAKEAYAIARARPRQPRADGS